MTCPHCDPPAEPDAALLYDGPCLNCGGMNHERLSYTERECWECFSVFVVPAITDSPA